MAKTSTNREVKRKQFRLFLWLFAGISLALLFLAVVLRQLYLGPNNALLGEDLDAIVFESTIVIAGTFLATVLVGLLIDDYRDRFEQDDGGQAKALALQGFTRTFHSANDPELLEALADAIGSASGRVRALGLGLGILHNNRALLNSIAARVNATDHLTVEIYLGSGDNLGVQNRIAEEAAWHEDTQIHYDPKWVRNFPNEIRSVLKHEVEDSRESRVKVIEVDSCPMLGLVQADDRFFMFLYGSPDLRGSESPWIQFDRVGSGAGQAFIATFSRTLDYYSEGSATESTGSTTASTGSA